MVGIEPEPPSPPRVRTEGTINSTQRQLKEVSDLVDLPPYLRGITPLPVEKVTTPPKIMGGKPKPGTRVTLQSDKVDTIAGLTHTPGGIRAPARTTFTMPNGVTGWANGYSDFAQVVRYHSENTAKYLDTFRKKVGRMPTEDIPQSSMEMLAQNRQLLEQSLASLETARLNWTYLRQKVQSFPNGKLPSLGEGTPKPLILAKGVLETRKELERLNAVVHNKLNKAKVAEEIQAQKEKLQREALAKTSEGRAQLAAEAKAKRQAEQEKLSALAANYEAWEKENAERLANAPQVQEIEPVGKRVHPPFMGKPDRNIYEKWERQDLDILKSTIEEKTIEKGWSPEEAKQNESDFLARRTNQRLHAAKVLHQIKRGEPISDADLIRVYDENSRAGQYVIADIDNAINEAEIYKDIDTLVNQFKRRKSLFGELSTDEALEFMTPMARRVQEMGGRVSDLPRGQSGIYRFFERVLGVPAEIAETDPGSTRLKGDEEEPPSTPQEEQL